MCKTNKKENKTFDYFRSWDYQAYFRTNEFGIGEGKDFVDWLDCEWRTPNINNCTYSTVPDCDKNYMAAVICYGKDNFILKYIKGHVHTLSDNFNITLSFYYILIGRKKR